MPAFSMNPFLTGPILNGIDEEQPQLQQQLMSLFPSYQPQDQLMLGALADAAMQQQLAAAPQPLDGSYSAKPQGAKPGSTSARNLANYNYGNIKTTSGGWAVYDDRISGAMGIGERALRYSNAPDRGWHAQSLLDFTNIYAPSSDRNRPGEYAAFLGRHMGISPTARVDFRNRDVLAGLIKYVPEMEHGPGRAQITDAEAYEAADRLLRGERPRLRAAATAASGIINRWGYR